MWKKIKNYVYKILLSLAVGGLAAFFTRNNMNIYDDIISPPLSPPMWLFPVAWSILYILMGISAAMIEKEGGSLKIFYLQLAVNFFWSIIFFNLRMFALSALWLVLLICLIIRMMWDFRSIDIRSSYLQVPYLIWCVFALYLNVAIAILN